MKKFILFLAFGVSVGFGMPEFALACSGKASSCGYATTGAPKVTAPSKPAPVTSNQSYSQRNPTTYNPPQSYTQRGVAVGTPSPTARARSINAVGANNLPGLK